jgi:hypothetical protein
MTSERSYQKALLLLVEQCDSLLGEAAILTRKINECIILEWDQDESL